MSEKYKYFIEEPTMPTEEAMKMWDKVVPPPHGEIVFNDNEAVIMSHYTFYRLMGGIRPMGGIEE